MMQTILATLAALQIQTAAPTQNPILDISSPYSPIPMISGTHTELTGQLAPGESTAYDFRFTAGEWKATVVGFGADTDVNLYIYDSNGNLIAKDDDLSSFVIITLDFNQRKSVRFVLENDGVAETQYVLGIK